VVPGCGIFYSVNLSTHVESILYTFESSTGIYPTGLLADGKGNFYGDTQQGGTFGTDAGVRSLNSFPVKMAGPNHFYMISAALMMPMTRPLACF